VGRRPLDKAEIEEGLRAEVLNLPDQLRAFFQSVVVEVHEATCPEFPGRPVFVVARSVDRAIFYDDAEEDFGIGAFDGQARLKDCGLIGELQFALIALQGGRKART
jgi:hypothetical protein